MIFQSKDSHNYLVAIWSSGKEKNRRCFKGKVSNDTMLVEKVKRLIVTIWGSPMPHFKSILMNSILQNWKEVVDSHPHSMRISPSWRPPPLDALTLNFDGSATSNPGMAGVGVLFAMRKGSSYCPILIQPAFAISRK